MMNKAKKWMESAMALTIAAVLAVGVAGCGTSGSDSVNSNAAESDTVESDASGSDDADASQADTGELKTIRIGAVGQSNVLNDAAGIAQQLGYLDEELQAAGYKAEVIGFAQAGPAINEAFAAGEIDMAVYGDLPATVCKASGVDTTIFATDNSKMQMGIFVNNDSDITSAADLKGHKVIVARGTIYHQYFKSLIADAGISEDEIEQINTFSDASSVIASGEADALLTSTSIAYYLEEQGIGKVIETTEEHPEWTSQFFAVGKTEFLQENPEAAKAFIRALIRAKDYAAANPSEVYSILAGMSEGYTEEIYANVYAFDESFDYYSPEIDEQGMEKLKALEQFLEDEALISTSVDMDTFVDTSYYDAVVSEN